MLTSFDVKCQDAEVNDVVVAHESHGVARVNSQQPAAAKRAEIQMLQVQKREVYSFISRTQTSLFTSLQLPMFAPEQARLLMNELSNKQSSTNVSGQDHLHQAMTHVFAFCCFVAFYQGVAVTTFVGCISRLCIHSAFYPFKQGVIIQYAM